MTIFHWTLFFLSIGIFIFIGCSDPSSEGLVDGNSIQGSWIKFEDTDDSEAIDAGDDGAYFVVDNSVSPITFILYDLDFNESAVAVNDHFSGDALKGSLSVSDFRMVISYKEMSSDGGASWGPTQLPGIDITGYYDFLYLQNERLLTFCTDPGFFGDWLLDGLYESSP